MDVLTQKVFGDIPIENQEYKFDYKFISYINFLPKGSVNANISYESDFRILTIILFINNQMYNYGCDYKEELINDDFYNEISEFFIRLV